MAFDGQNRNGLPTKKKVRESVMSENSLFLF